MRFAVVSARLGTQRSAFAAHCNRSGDCRGVWGTAAGHASEETLDLSSDPWCFDAPTQDEMSSRCKSWRHGAANEELLGSQV